MVQSGSYVSDSFPNAIGRYQLKERLALGGMAELFLAEVAGAHGFAKNVVIKRILPHLASDEQFKSMFISEAKFTAQLVHPKIAQTLELGTEDKQLFIVMEYIEGLDVLALLRECAHRRSRVPAEVSVYIIKEVLDALDFAHKLTSERGEPLGIVHRDVSPSNVLLSTRGDVKLIDFGIAHAVSQEGQSKTGTLKGKYGYMSPEQVLGQTVSPRSDLFATGVVLAEMLMGRRLFAAANELDVLLMVRDVDLSRMERFGTHIDPGLASFLRWALRKDPGDRYRDAGEFRDVLDEWLFDHRHRVSNAQLADIVNSLYGDALKRRKENLKNSAFIQAIGSGVVENATHRKSEAAVSVSFRSAAEELAAQAKDAVPLGMDLGDREEDAEPSAVMEVSSEDLAQQAPAKAEQDLLPEVPSEAAPLRRASTRAETVEQTPPSNGVEKTANPPSIRVVATMNPAEGFAAEEALRELRRSSSHETISAAVASVSPVEPDPASRDFDDTDVSGSGEHKRPTRMPSSDELADPPTTPTLQYAGEDAAHSGSLRETCALRVLYKTTAERATGKVVIELGGVRKVIFFKRGVPEFVSSNIARELFGAYLVRQRVIASGELDMALAVLPHFGGKLGDTLVGLGLMKPLEVFRHLTRQVRSKLIEVCTWTQGEYQWYPGARCPKQSFPLDLDPLEVYGAGAMAMPLESLKSWCSRHAEFRPIAARSSVVVPELFQVPGIRACQELMDGSKTLTQRFASAEKTTEGLQQMRLVFLLVNTSLLVDVSTVTESG